MKTIIINSKVHGTHQVFVDDEDYEYVKKFKWHIDKGAKTYYALRYITINNKRKRLSMHRDLLGLTNPKQFGDHKDLNGLNNQRDNIRIATKAQNMRNRGANNNSTSKFCGVSWNSSRNKWASHICVDSKSIYLGLFKNETEAALKYNEKAKEYFGEFANLNIIS